MKSPLFLSIFLLLPLTCSFCQKPSVTSSNQVTPIKQGVCGTIIFKSGNFMPSPDVDPPKGKPVKRDVVIYELTNAHQVTSEGEFHRNIKTKIIKKVTSDLNGNFCIDLPEGQYSLFIWEDEKGLYANSFDGQNNIFPIKISKNKVSKVDVTISYSAAF